MSKIMKADLKKPATLQAVLEAVVQLGAHDESQILDLATAGKLADLFPFRPGRPRQTSADFLPESALIEASPLPLNAAQRARLMQSSMPAASTRVRPAAPKPKIPRKARLSR